MTRARREALEARWAAPAEHQAELQAIADLPIISPHAASEPASDRQSIDGHCSYCGYLAECRPLDRSALDGRHGRFQICITCDEDLGWPALAAPERVGPGRETRVAKRAKAGAAHG